MTPHPGASCVRVATEGFKKFHWHGKKHELSDLRALLKKYQAWAFAMDPADSMDDIVVKLEKFGSMAPVHVRCASPRAACDDYDAEGLPLCGAIVPVSLQAQI